MCPRRISWCLLAPSSWSWSILARRGQWNSAASKQHGDGVTQPYAAPERLTKDAPEDFRSDIFSLSVVAYELLTLELPLMDSEGQAGLPHVVEHAQGSYRAPAELLRETNRLPREAVDRLNHCLAAGLALHPDDRFGTRAEWLAAWDGVHNALRTGNRLSPWERARVTGI